MSRSMKETPHRATDCSDQMGCRLTDEPTTPPYQRRPRTASGTSAVLWPPTAASPSVRQEQPHGWGSRAWDRGGSDDSRLLRIGCYYFSSARAGSVRWACSFFFGRWSSAKARSESSEFPKILAPTEHNPNVAGNCSKCKEKWRRGDLRFEI